MADPVSGNLAMLMQVVDRLAPLLDRFVFLGGVVTELLITSTAAGSPRQTKDVDVVVNVLNLGSIRKPCASESSLAAWSKTQGPVRPSVAGASTI